MAICGEYRRQTPRDLFTFTASKVCRQEFAPRLLLVGRRVLVACRHRQCGIIDIVEHVEQSRRAPKLELRRVGCGESLGIVTRQEPRLQFEHPVPEEHQGHPIPGQLRLEGCLAKLRVIEVEKVSVRPCMVAMKRCWLWTRTGHLAR